MQSVPYFRPSEGPIPPLECAERERVLREAFEAEHRRFEQVVAASRQVVYEADVPAQTIAFSGSLFEVFGYTVEAHGESADSWRRRIHDDDRDRVLREGARVLTTGTVDVEYRYRHADGYYRWVWDRGVCEHDGDGRIVKVVGMMQDITGRKELEAQVNAARRMETMGSLAGGVAHDVNNYLTTILGNIDVALMRLGDAADWPELVDAREAAVGCAGLVRNLLMFARQHHVVRERIEAATVIEGMARMLTRLAGHRVCFTHETGADCPPFEADRVQVQQVLMNLVVNARDAMGGAGDIHLKASRAIRPSPEGVGREYARFTVTDTGPGVPAGVRDRIFEPFFSTRDAGAGMGLGLSIVDSVARSHGGFAELDDRPGPGASFSVYFPAPE